jgi:hypothetical protein
MKRLIINESERELIKLLHESAIKNEKKKIISEGIGQTKEEYQACIKQMGSPKEVYTGQWSIAGIKSVAGYKFYSNMRAMTPNSVMTNYSCSGNKIVIDGKTYTVSSSTKKSSGYYIKQAQTLLGVPTTGIVDDKTLEAAKGIQNTSQAFSGATANSGTTTTTTVSPVTTTSSDL